MSERITNRQYFEEVRDTASSILAETKEYLEEGEDLRERLEEYLWETIDGHQWVIYTWYAQQILSISENSDYAIENFGIESATNEAGINWSGLAFGALYADVSEVLWGLVEEEVSA